MRRHASKDFLWGTATSSYQIEGAVDEDDRGKSIWDIFSHTPGKIEDGFSGDRANEHYHRYKEDVRLIKALGVKTYRFSMAWTRVFPDGTGRPNLMGLDFYNRLVDELLANGIEPAPRSTIGTCHRRSRTASAAGSRVTRRRPSRTICRLCRGTPDRSSEERLSS